jgi:hypothetical protein
MANSKLFKSLIHMWLLMLGSTKILFNTNRNYLLESKANLLTVNFIRKILDIKRPDLVSEAKISFIFTR